MAHRVKASQQMERDFVANVSHELKTPLTSIKGFSQAILDGAVDNVAAREHAARVIYDEANRLHRLVEDLLDLAKIDSGQIEFGRKPVNLGLLVRNVIEKLSLRAAEKGIDITDRLPELPIIIGDGDRLAQVLTNLCDNAIQHTPEGKTVCVHGETEGNWVSIHVDDSGPGIPPSELSRIFERFYQIDKARKHGKGQGSGLGLAISREIVRAHGGRLVAQSVAGYGSRFSLSLPIVQPGDETLASSQS
jgi:signal transduction histidine kinase